MSGDLPPFLEGRYGTRASNAGADSTESEANLAHWGSHEQAIRGIDFMTKSGEIRDRSAVESLLDRWNQMVASGAKKGNPRDGIRPGSAYGYITLGEEQLEVYLVDGQLTLDRPGRRSGNRG